MIVSVFPAVDMVEFSSPRLVVEEHQSSVAEKSDEKSRDAYQYRNHEMATKVPTVERRERSVAQEGYNGATHSSHERGALRHGRVLRGSFGSYAFAFHPVPTAL